MKEILCSEPFILALTFGSYFVGLKIEKATKLSIANPLLIAMFIIIGVMLLLDIDYESYKEGSHFIELLLGPSVVALGYTLYKQIENIKGNMLSILSALFVGSIVGVTSIIAVCRIFDIPQDILISIEPKSVTMPIALGISQSYGGISALTAISVVCCGIFGCIVGPWILKLIRIKSKIAKGLALGAAAHGIGTSKAMQIGPVEGAFGGMAIGIMGVFTALAVAVINRI